MCNKCVSSARVKSFHDKGNVVLFKRVNIFFLFHIYVVLTKDEAEQIAYQSIHVKGNTGSIRLYFRKYLSTRCKQIIKNSSWNIGFLYDKDALIG